ncbi:MAG: class I SAM-dependent RNA methyltransferase [Actinomycetes bacterium]
MSRRDRDVPPLPTTPLEASVDGFTHGGEGVARVEGKAVFVAGALPGERVRLRVVEDRPRWARAELVEVLDGSPDRVEPPCPYLPDCGGCDLQHASPAAQRALKTRVVREQLERIGRLVDPPVADCLAVGPDTGYRTHAQLHAGPDGRLGFHRAGSHEVVAVDRCLVLAPEAQAVRDEVGDGTGAQRVAVRGHAAGAAAVLTPGPGGMDLPDGEADLLLEQPDGSAIAIRGEGVCTEEVAGLALSFPATSFFQVNTAGAEALVAHVLAAAGDLAGAVAWDLYAGVGLLSLPLARAGASVTAVEGDEAAAEWCERNAATHDLDVLVEADDVRDFVARSGDATGPHGEPDVVVLDPPRTGAGIEVVAAIAALLPATIVYVACDPAALARDARALADAGYRLVGAQPLDLFPHTHHVEVVARFVR